MDNFLIGATVPCSVKSQVFSDVSGDWVETDQDSGYPKVTIYKPDGSAAVSDQVLTKITTARYRYVFATTGLAAGFYKRVYAGKVTVGPETHYPMHEDGFWLKAAT